MNRGQRGVLAFVGLTFFAVAGCAVEESDDMVTIDEEINLDDIDQVQQGIGEAACATYTSPLLAEGVTRANLTCPALRSSPNASYGGAGSPCSRAYYQEVTDITSASNIRVTVGWADDFGGITVDNCTSHTWRGEVYATDTTGATVHVGSINGGGVVQSIPTPPYSICIITTGSSLTFPRVSGGRTFVKARVVAQARRLRPFPLLPTYHKVSTRIENAAALCP